ncbi:MAG: helix-turn-helix transcriptional regulator [Pseudomonadota bacterium]
MPLTHDTDIYGFAGQRIRVRRVLMGMSEKHLAEATGISLYMLRRYERGEGNITMDKVDSIAATLDVPIGYFFSET